MKMTFPTLNAFSLVVLTTFSTIHKSRGSWLHLRYVLLTNIYRKTCDYKNYTTLRQELHVRYTVAIAVLFENVVMCPMSKKHMVII